MIPDLEEGKGGIRAHSMGGRWGELWEDEETKRITMKKCWQFVLSDLAALKLD